MQGLASPAAVPSQRCAPFCGRSGRSRAPRTSRRPPSAAAAGQQGGCGRPLDRVAGWVGGGIAAAFFASLERCSCVNVRTHDELDDEQRESEAPLIMFDDGNGRGAAGAGAGADVSGGRRRGSGRNDKGKSSGAGGMGCYGDY
ncbi:hypothetical protein GUJ93_ZPchr0003g18095 [Zizania palustris]|uniref:Uncharacterized protein n=1 Tax=Zizania palustris TaxID=103762 RepID=A0A8J5VJF2_ZIZPA|nr:hypothetical protein GUJ93_ZPchr0003g18095 [Zizania palustris]